VIKQGRLGSRHYRGIHWQPSLLLWNNRDASKAVPHFDLTQFFAPFYIDIGDSFDAPLAAKL
jgi:hypothetical protein